MIISASRRTDIPAFYSKWFINRVRAGWCQVPNPLDYSQLSYVSLKPEDVDAIVFWSKNPVPMFEYLDELDAMGFRYYFQFTLNDYPQYFEPEMPSFEERVQTFKRLGTRLEPLRIIWRYDPIIISNITPIDYHLDKFFKIAQALKGLTKRVVISFVDYYKKTERNLSHMGKLGIRFNKRAAYSGRAYSLVENLAEIAQDHGMEIFTCAEEIDFSKVGVPPGRCIDGELLYELWSLHGHDKKDPAQRASCLCAVAKDIGVNDTCIHGCPYCYSTRSLILARRRYSEHDPNSPVIWGSGRPLSEAEKADQLKVRLL